MNLLRTIIERLNQRIEVANIFDKQFGLCELNANGNDKAWVHYIGNGQAEVVTNFDAKQGTLFWAKRGKVTVAKTDAYKMSGCKQLYVTSFPLTAYAVVRKSHLPCDGDDAQDWLASRIYKITSGTDPLFKQSIGVINYEVIPSGYINEIKTLTANYEWACVTVDFDIQVITSTEDGCYDICATGDIPLPDLPACVPCLTEVAVDGVTIIGNGTAADPLSAIGAGGGAIVVQDEGTEITPVATTLNFTGEGVTASLTSPGVVEVNVPGGGGAVGTLQEVTDLGNSTTNDIAFTASAGILLDNGARLRKGTTNAGLGGNNGIAQRCSIDYELKWEAGRLYYMEQDGFTIREVSHTFGFIPTTNDDASNGFVVGSRWSLDDGTVYLCSDATIGAAVWAVVTASVSSLQDVTDVGNTTTNDLIVQGANDFVGQVSSQTISAYNSVTGAYAEMFVGTNGQLTLSDGSSAGILSINNITNANVQLEFPNKTTGNYTIATTADLPSTIVEDVTATAPIASSGGANPDISITQANGSTDGYLTSTDWNTFDGKFNVPTGLSTDYLDGTGTPTAFPAIPSGTVTSVDLTMPPAFSVTGNPVTSSGTLAVAAAGLSSQYIRGDGQLANFPTSSGGGSSLSYYLNGSVAQGTLGGVAFKQMSGTPVIGAGTDFTINADGYIQSFITDASVPNQLAIPAGNWNFEMYFSASSAGGTPRFYIELYKLSAGTLTLIASNSATPEFITNGTQIDLYTTALAVPSTVLLAADRLAVRVYVIHSSKTITLHTEDNHLCQVITTFSTGINALNGLTAQVQNFAVGTSGTDFAISSSTDTHTFNLPTASASNRGALSSADWSTFNGKQAALGFTPVTDARTITINGTTQDLSADRSWTISAAAAYKSTTDTAGFTGTTNTAVYTQLIPANTYTIGDIVRVTYRTRKTGGNGNQTIRIYVNSTADLNGTPILIGGFNSAGANSFLVNQLLRHLVIKSSTNNTEVFTAAGTAASSDYGLYNGVTTCAINWTLARYFVFAIQSSSATDVNFGSMYLIEKL